MYNAFDHDLVTDAFKNCRGKLLKVGKNVQQRTTRNPFNRNSTPPYDGYIYEIDLEKLKNCKIKKWKKNYIFNLKLTFLIKS